jgi:HEPN domain-containing protein
MSELKESPAPSNANLDDESWLTRYSAQGWIERALQELSLARQAFANRQVSSAAAALKRAAGMALNGALRVVPRKEWGRSYVEHLQALTRDPSAPSAVVAAAGALLEFVPNAGGIALLRTPAQDERLLEAARTVMAHAYAIVNGSAGRSSPGS